MLANAVASVAAGDRVAARAAGGDRTTAERIVAAALARPWPVQVTKVRCERYGEQRFCGLTLTGVRFHARIDRAAFEAEVDALVRAAFAADPRVVEVDCWATVPVDAGKGAVVSGDFAQPTSATVFALSAKRGDPAPSRARDVFWDPRYRAELERGTSG